MGVGVDSLHTCRFPAAFWSTAMGLYRNRILPWLVDRGTSHASLLDFRRELVAEARGRVLEIGFGPGASVPHYGAIERLVALEPDQAMVRRARSRLATARFPVQVVHARAEQLPFQDQTFDTVVSVLSMCSFGSVSRALREVRRVLRPEGAFLFLEHGRAHDFWLWQWQRRLTPVQRRLFGCRLEVEVDRAVIESGLRLDVMEHLLLTEGPTLTSQLYRGVARLEEAATSPAWVFPGQRDVHGIAERMPAMLAR
jgi:SAM-dependent methyltransferase